MDALTITLKNPTSEGRIYYKTDPQVEKNLIFLQSKNHRNIVYKILINNEVIIEMDGNKLLYDVEVLFPRRSWKIENSVSIPDNFEEADMVFSNIIEKSEFYDLPVRVVADSAYSVAKVILGQYEEPLRAISLSDRFFALVHEQRLVGFIIHLIKIPS
jgi:hypothetical protein